MHVGTCAGDVGRVHESKNENCSEKFLNSIVSPSRSLGSVDGRVFYFLALYKKKRERKRSEKEKDRTVGPRELIVSRSRGMPESIRFFERHDSSIWYISPVDLTSQEQQEIKQINILYIIIR